MLGNMQRTLIFTPADPSEVESNPVFNVLIAYEDFETGKHAKETYDFLAENLGKECRLTNQMWKFDVLSIPKLREIAVRDATTADIILISCHDDSVPDYVMKWTESWLMEGSQALALVALFDQPAAPTGRGAPAREYFSDVAMRAHMEFFAQPGNWPGADRRIDPFLLRRDSLVSERALSTLAGAVPRDVTPRWGINE
jgi:hypothetical protein